MRGPKIILNAAECKTCHLVLVSIHRHDYRACPCGNAVDGGHDYLKRAGNPDAMEELTIVQEEDKSLRRLGWKPEVPDARA